MDFNSSGVEVRGVWLEAEQRGAGRPVLYLHGEAGPDRDAPVVGLLSKCGRLVAPSHPGFGNSPVVTEFTGVDDLAFLYLDLLDRLELQDVALVGVGMGGWIAAEMAVMGSPRLSRLVLVDAVGIKAQGREVREIADIFALTPEQLAPLAWADPALGLPDTTQLPEQTLLDMARARESAARYGWSPYMHNPKLMRRLARVRVPTLVVWGEADRISPPEYGRAYAAAIPDARFETIAGAGHYPQIEQPDAFARIVSGFLV
jgi:pimeloyl-ACP methyl ester carboxylesterase